MMSLSQISRLARCVTVQSCRLANTAGAISRSSCPASSLHLRLSPPSPCRLAVSPFSGASSSAGDGNIIAIQDDVDFHTRVRESDKPVIVQFHATWCAPCKLLKPRLESAVKGKEGLLLASVDVDHLPDVCVEFKVASVPSVFAFNNGEIIDGFVGLKEETSIKDFVDTFAEKCGV